MFLQEAHGLGLAQVPSHVTQLSHTVISSGGLSAGAERSETCEPGRPACHSVLEPRSQCMAQSGGSVKICGRRKRGKGKQEVQTLCDEIRKEIQKV